MTAESFDIEWPYLVLLWAGMAIPAWLGFRALRTGRVHEADGGYSTREGQPLLYWSAMAIGGIVLLCGFAALIGMTARSIGVF